MKNKKWKEMAQQVISSEFYKKAQEKAKIYLSENGKLADLLEKAEKKTMHTGKKKLGFLEKIKTLIRMIKAYHAGKYKEIPWTSIVFMVAGLVYFISPIDLIPDFLPFLGLGDDISLIFFIFNSMTKDIEAFHTWEENQSLPIIIE
jgi:uncharacterized membrane protein YkvA (DUF1232 family)